MAKQKRGENLNEAFEDVHDATEVVLNAALDLAKLKGVDTVKKVKKPVFALAKHVDRIHRRVKC